MALEKLNSQTKFRESDDYDHKQLVRDLKEYARMLESEIATLKARLQAAGIP